MIRYLITICPTGALLHYLTYLTLAFVELCRLSNLKKRNDNEQISFNGAQVQLKYWCGLVGLPKQLPSRSLLSKKKGKKRTIRTVRYMLRSVPCCARDWKTTALGVNL